MKVSLKSLAKSVASAATPERLASKNIQVSAAVIRANSANTGSVFLGDETSQLYEIPKGAELALSDMLDSIGAGEDTVNLQDIFVKVATNGDGVTVLYADRSAI